MLNLKYSCQNYRIILREQIDTLSGPCINISTRHSGKVPLTLPFSQSRAPRDHKRMALVKTDLRNLCLNFNVLFEIGSIVPIALLYQNVQK